MLEFETRVAGIPCMIRVTDYEPYRPAYTSGLPENCYPAEGGVAEWQVCDRRGRPAGWLETKLTDADISRIDDEIFRMMECDD